MLPVRYYRFSDLLNEGNVADDSDDFIVNCAGLDMTEEPFHTQRINGRLDYYFIFVLDGSIEFCDENEDQVVVKPGMGIILFSGFPHNYYSLTDQVNFYWAHFTGERAENYLSRFGFQHAKPFDIGSNERIVHLFHKIFREFTIKNVDYVFCSSLYLLEIFAEIRRSLQQKIAKTTVLEKSLTYIHNNYFSDIPIGELAQLESMSESHYRHLFLELMDISPKQYILSLRMVYASNLLQTTQKPVSEIAAQCGYDNLGYFYRTFKKFTNLTPLECRNKIEKESK